MKKINIFAITLLFMLSVVTNTLAAETLTITAKESSCKVEAGEELFFSATTTSNTQGIKTIEYKMYNETTGKLIGEKSFETKNENGAKPLNMKIYAPNPAAAKFKVLVSAMDITGAKVNKTFNYTMDAVAAEDNEIILTASKSSGSLNPNELIVLKGEATAELVGIKTISYKVYDNNTGKILEQNTGVSSYELGSRSLTYKIYAPLAGITTSIRVDLECTDIKGKVAKKSFNYTMDKVTVDNVLTVNATPSSGTLKGNQEVVISISATEVGVKTISYKMYDATTGKLLKSNSATSSRAEGASPLTYKIIAPETGVKSLRIEVEGIDIAGKTVRKTFNYTMDTVVEEANVISISATPSTGKLTIEQEIAISAAVTKVGAKTISYKMYDATTGKLIKSNSVSTSRAEGSNPLTYKIYAPSENVAKVRVEVEAADVNGKTARETFNYTMDEVQSDIEMNLIAIPGSGKVAKEAPIKLQGTTVSDKFGIKTISYKMINSATGAIIKSNSQDSSYINGSSPFNYTVQAPDMTVPNFKIEATATGMDGKTITRTFNYTMADDVVIPSGYTLSVSSSPVDGSFIVPSQKIIYTAKASNSDVKIKSISYKMYDNNTGEFIKSATGNSTSAAGATPLKYEIVAPSKEIDEIRVDVVVKDAYGKGLEKSFTYIMDEDDKDDNIDEDDEGIINDDLDDLAIDLITASRETIFELDEEIEFKAYYYNAEEKAKKDVKIYVEIPDGYEVEDKGGAVLKRDELIFDIGTVKSEELSSVNFVLVPEDDDLCEEITTVIARIESDGDEEDTSTVKLLIYEEGGRGTHEAYVIGYKDGTFKPDNFITREEVAAMIAREFEYQSTSTVNPFTDVRETSWSYNYIKACAQRGVVTGYKDGTFKQYNNITRGELYAMIYRALEISADEKALFVPKEYKRDSSWEKNYVAGLDRLNMIEEMDDTDPDELATRADAVFLINRVRFRKPAINEYGIFPDINGHWAMKDIMEAAVTHDYRRSSSGREIVY